MVLSTVVEIAVGVLAYLGVGWWFMRRDLPTAWDRARKGWRSSEWFYSAKSMVEWHSLLMVLGWPLIGPWRELQRTVVVNDPVQVQRRLDESERRRKAMEKDLDAALEQSRQALKMVKEQGGSK